LHNYQICHISPYYFESNLSFLSCLLNDALSLTGRSLVFQVLRVGLTNMTSQALSSIAADPVVGAWGPLAYVGGSRGGSLLVIGQRGWWQIGLDVKSSEEEHMHTVGAATLALSRREPLLYLTAPDSDLMFSLDLSAIRSSPKPSNNVSLVCATSQQH
jgi:hypothetical protein